MGFERSYVWDEQYLLQSFLAFDGGAVLRAGSYMHLRHPDKLETAFNSYTREERWRSSFWIRKSDDIPTALNGRLFYFHNGARTNHLQTTGSHPIRKFNPKEVLRLRCKAGVLNVKKSQHTR